MIRYGSWYFYVSSLCVALSIDALFHRFDFCMIISNINYLQRSHHTSDEIHSRSAKCFEWILHCARVPIMKYSLETPDHLHTVFISPSLFRPHTGFTFFATSGSASCSTRPLAFPYPVAQITTSAGSSDPSSNTMLFFEKWEIWESFLSFTFPSTMSWLQPISKVFVHLRTSSG